MQKLLTHFKILIIMSALCLGACIEVKNNDKQEISTVEKFLELEEADKILSDFISIWNYTHDSPFPILSIKSKKDKDGIDVLTVNYVCVNTFIGEYRLKKDFDYIKTINNNLLFMEFKDCDNIQPKHKYINILKKIIELNINENINKQANSNIIYLNEPSFGAVFDIFETPYMYIYMKESGKVDKILFNDGLTDLNTVDFDKLVWYSKQRDFNYDWSKFKYFKLSK